MGTAEDWVLDNQLCSTSYFLSFWPLGWRYQIGWIFGKIPNALWWFNHHPWGLSFFDRYNVTKSHFNTISPILVEFWERSTASKEQRPLSIIIIVITIITTDVIIFKILVFWSFLISLINKGCALVCGFCESHQNMIITSAPSSPQQHINPWFPALQTECYFPSFFIFGWIQGRLFHAEASQLAKHIW